MRQFSTPMLTMAMTNGHDNTRFDTFSDYEGRDEQESLATSLRGKWTGLDKVSYDNNKLPIPTR